MGSRWSMAAGAALGALALAGCGGGGSKAGSAPTSTASAAKAAPVNYGQQYLTILAPYDAFATKNQNAKLTPALTSQLESILTTTGTKLTTATWPANAQTDVRSFAQDIAAMNTALQNNNSSSFTTADDQGQSAANLVRHDLGLPAAPQ